MRVIPVTLPLNADTARCLGRWDKPSQVCAKRDECARHVTMNHDAEPWTLAKPYFRLCDAGYSLMVPLSGYEVEND
jgi:hypothetical protein